MKDLIVVLEALKEARRYINTNPHNYAEGDEGDHHLKIAFRDKGKMDEAIEIVDALIKEKV